MSRHRHASIAGRERPRPLMGGHVMRRQVCACGAIRYCLEAPRGRTKRDKWFRPMVVTEGGRRTPKALAVEQIMIRCFERIEDETRARFEKLWIYGVVPT